MALVLISTLFNPDPVLLAITKLSPTRLILLVTDKNDKDISKAIKLIKDSIGRVISTEILEIPQYDILKISSKVIKLIDNIKSDQEIILNITSGRKTQSIGVLYAAFSRKKRIKRIAYYPEGEEKGKVIYLPIPSVQLKDSQINILKFIKKRKALSYKELENLTGLSTAMVYRAVEELINEGLVERTEKGLSITEAGLLVILWFIPLNQELSDMFINKTRFLE